MINIPDNVSSHTLKCSILLAQAKALELKRINRTCGTNFTDVKEARKYFKKTPKFKEYLKKLHKAYPPEEVTPKQMEFLRKIAKDHDI